MIDHDESEWNSDEFVVEDTGAAFMQPEVVRSLRAEVLLGASRL